MADADDVLSAALARAAALGSGDEQSLGRGGRHPRARQWLVAAAVFGAAHTAVSAYWMFGGTALVDTVGERVVAIFEGRPWLLAPVVVAKAAVALGPVLLDRRGWPHRRLLRPLSWLVGAGLVIWGGLNTLVANLALAGLVPAGDDRAGLIGHAWLWDPLFLVWGLCLLFGLWRGRHPITP